MHCDLLSYVNRAEVCNKTEVDLKYSQTAISNKVINHSVYLLILYFNSIECLSIYSCGSVTTSTQALGFRGNQREDNKK